MRSLGLAIKKNEIWFSVVEGESMGTSNIVETGKQNFRAESQRLICWIASLITVFLKM